MKIQHEAIVRKVAKYFQDNNFQVYAHLKGWAPQPPKLPSGHKSDILAFRKDRGWHKTRLLLVEIKTCDYIQGSDNKRQIEEFAHAVDEVRKTYADYYSAGLLVVPEECFQKGLELIYQDRVLYRLGTTVFTIMSVRVSGERRPRVTILQGEWENDINRWLRLRDIGG